MQFTAKYHTMIGRLSGILLEKNPPQLLIDCQGVGYEVGVPMSTFYNLPALGEKVVLLTHLAVREDAHLLYGFASVEERNVFKELIKISGVGARTALVHPLRHVGGRPGAGDHPAGIRTPDTRAGHRQKNRRAPLAGTEGQAGCRPGRCRRGCRPRRCFCRYHECLAGAGLFRQGSRAGARSRCRPAAAFPKASSWR